MEFFYLRYITRQLHQILNLDFVSSSLCGCRNHCKAVSMNASIPATATNTTTAAADQEYSQKYGSCNLCRNWPAKWRFRSVFDMINTIHSPLREIVGSLQYSPGDTFNCLAGTTSTSFFDFSCDAWLKYINLTAYSKRWGVALFVKVWSDSVLESPLAWCVGCSHNCSSKGSTDALAGVCQRITNIVENVAVDVYCLLGHKET